jgi:hypothetical protein
LIRVGFCVLALITIQSCSSGGGDGGATPTPSPNLSLAVGIKQLQFSWSSVSGVDDYRLFENSDGASGFTQVGANLPSGTTSTSMDIAVHRHNFTNARYLVKACNSGGCTSSNEVNTVGTVLDAIGYVKASNSSSEFGAAMALSADGNTLAVGAPYEPSNAVGVNGDQNNTSAIWAGAVYVFTRTSGSWVQDVYLKASNTDAFNQFGSSISLSSDGTTLAVGAPGEDSNAIGIDGDQTDDSAADSGAVYIFSRSNGTWSQQAYVKASNAGGGDLFGGSVALSNDGSTLVVGARTEASNATGVGGDQFDNSAYGTGAAYVFTRSGGVWAQQAYLKALNPDPSDAFGLAVAISGDGNTLAVGTIFEASNATGVGGDQTDNSAFESGAVYVFIRSGGSWMQEAYLKASNSEAFDRFGSAVSFSDDGNTLAVGAVFEHGGASGVNGDQTNNDAVTAGAAYVFTRSGSTWSQQAYVKASNTEEDDQFGQSLAISSDGNTLAVAAWLEGSGTDGVGGNQADNSAHQAGAVYTFTRNGSTWSQQAYIKASNSGRGDEFGCSLAMSGDGNTLAVGARYEASSATGVGGDQTDNSGGGGAVYLY